MRRAWVVVLAVVAGCGPPGPVTVATLNIANGAGDLYRTADARARQAALLDQVGAQLVALEEVDVDVVRSGGIDTARAVARSTCAPGPLSVDGVRRCEDGGGVVLFGLGFRGDDPFDAVNGVPSGIQDDDTSLNPTSVDISHDALYGNALLVRGLSVGDAYAVQLPSDAAQPTSDPLDARLAAGDVVDGDARAELGRRNDALRMGPAIEPRVALVARVPRGGARPLTLVATHLEAEGTAELRATQLARVLALAAAERAGPPARDVVVLGDLNMPAATAAPALEAAGFLPGAGAGIDQVWIDPRLTLLDGAELPTAGASDHPTLARVIVRE